MDHFEKKAWALFFVVAVVTAFGLAATAEPKARINVEEACEQLNTFMHEGKRYYCAPWVEYTNPAAPAPATEALSHA